VAAGLCVECECCHVRVRDGAEARIGQRANGILVRELQSEWVGSSLSGTSVGAVLAGGVRLHVHARHCHSGGLGQLELPGQTKVRNCNLLNRTSIAIAFG